jgi:hypothetical protein
MTVDSIGPILETALAASYYADEPLAGLSVVRRDFGSAAEKSPRIGVDAASGRLRV